MVFHRFFRDQADSRDSNYNTLHMSDAPPPPSLPMPACLSEDELAAFLDGRLSPESEARCEVHLDVCRACFGVLQALGGRPEGPPALAQTPDPERLAVPATFDE